ncbi:MAG: hypothetical protein MMC33_000479 [Icmadophila ericetorum]|nr:hypothetical protein [Icmadophila ericetorum]
MALGSSTFATFMILCPISFFLGILFSLFPYDYPLLWTTQNPLSNSTILSDAFTLYETHLSLLYHSPPLIPRILHIVIFVGLLGFFLKLYKPSESNMLFDGASLVLYMCGVTVYVTNIVKGLRVVATAANTISAPDIDPSTLTPEVKEDLGDLVEVSREDGLRVLAASNTILALILVGVLVLQAGQWYAEKKQRQEVERLDREEKEKKEAKGGRTGGTSTGAKKKA